MARMPHSFAGVRDSNTAAAPTTTHTTTVRELVVRFSRFAGGYWQYEGTRAQLEAEGVIPPDTQWPQGKKCLWWTEGRLRFRLCRTRPNGAKGSASVWAQADWWCLHCQTTTDPNPVAGRIQALASEMAKAIHESTPAGHREWFERFNRYQASRADKAFQGFMAALLPQRKKPGRPAQATATPTSQQGVQQ